MENGNYTVKGITSLEALGGNIGLLEIIFKERPDEPVYMFANYNDIVEFIDKQVIVEFREEVIKGKVSTVINNMSVVTQVTTLDKDQNIKLYSDETFEIGSNIILKDLKEGDHIEKAIVYCQDHIYETSAKATWVKLTVLDKHRNVGYLRVFDPDRSSINFKGKMIKAGVRFTKYGLVAQDVYVQSDLKVDSNPVVAIAKRMLYNVIETDTTLKQAVEQYDLINKLEEYSLIEGQEIGMLLVKTAVEIALLQETKNVTKHMRVDLLIRLAFASKMYTATHKETSTMSRYMQTFINVANSPLAKDRPLLICLDKESTISLPEKDYYEFISNAAQVVIDIKGPKDYILTSDKMFGGK